ncbi:MAG: hypothetical protein GF416_08430 [Candidatus Altiarchaeales archaeon]|nr:hypothetical protein [Candidatus Altiarchaeales archaeon]MBD3417141.1 hypothetical protein [Candidatus Altiarchaeales archaeon]
MGSTTDRTLVRRNVTGEAPGPVRQVNAGMLLDTVETGRDVGITGTYQPKTTERSRYRVLLPDEEAKAASGLEGSAARKAVLGEARKKLVEARVLWDSRKPNPHPNTEFYLDDTEAGLSPLEENMVEVQVQALIDNKPMDSLLISAAEIEQIKKRLESAGMYSEERLIEETMKFAEVRDDMRDLRSMGTEK